MRARYDASISVELMTAVLQTYIQLLTLKISVETLNLHEIKENKKDKQNLIYDLAATLSSAKDRLDELIEQLWCPKSKNRSAKDLFLTYEKLDETTKVEFNQAYPSVNALNAIFGKMDEPKQKNIKTKETKGTLLAMNARLFKASNKRDSKEGVEESPKKQRN